MLEQSHALKHFSNELRHTIEKMNFEDSSAHHPPETNSHHSGKNKRKPLAKSTKPEGKNVSHLQRKYAQFRKSPDFLERDVYADSEKQQDMRNRLLALGIMSS